MTNAIASIRHQTEPTGFVPRVVELADLRLPAIYVSPVHWFVERFLARKQQLRGSDRLAVIISAACRDQGYPPSAFRVDKPALLQIVDGHNG
jgi:hypothetical protein